eukprot:1158307-Pelagomonas_calceolata.AAC.11
MDPSLCVSRQILHIDLDGFYAQVAVCLLCEGSAIFDKLLCGATACILLILRLSKSVWAWTRASRWLYCNGKVGGWVHAARVNSSSYLAEARTEQQMDEIATAGQSN